MNDLTTTAPGPRYYIGGGNIAGILGVSKYRTPLREYQVIVGDEEALSKEKESFFRRRKAFEPVACEIFRESTGLDLVRVNHRYTDPGHDFMRAELDAEASDGGGVEIKTVHPYAAADWGNEDEGDCPIYVTAQVQHGLMVTGKPFTWVFGMVGFDDHRVYRIERDEEIIADMRAKEIAFWHDHVLPRVPPAPITVDDVKLLFSRDTGESIEAPAQIATRLNNLRDIKEQAKGLEAREKAEKEAIQLFMSGASSVSIGGKIVATWKAQDARRFDQKAFEADHPALFQKYKRVSTSRVFRIK